MQGAGTVSGSQVSAASRSKISWAVPVDGHRHQRHHQNQFQNQSQKLVQNRSHHGRLRQRFQRQLRERGQHRAVRTWDEGHHVDDPVEVVLDEEDAAPACQGLAQHTGEVVGTRLGQVHPVDGVRADDLDEQLPVTLLDPDHARRQRQHQAVDRVAVGAHLDVHRSSLVAELPEHGPEARAPRIVGGQAQAPLAVQHDDVAHVVGPGLELDAGRQDRVLVPHDSSPPVMGSVASSSAAEQLRTDGS